MQPGARSIPRGEVYATETPAATVALAVHVGAYDRMKEIHDAIHAWATSSNRAFAEKSWEIFGDLSGYFQQRVPEVGAFRR